MTPVAAVAAAKEFAAGTGISAQSLSWWRWSPPDLHVLFEYTRQLDLVKANNAA